MKTDALILTLAFFCGVVVYSDACSCSIEHPQNHYCKSDFVILARVRRETAHNKTRVFKVHVRKEFKVSEKGGLALKSGRINTALYDGMCRLHLDVGKLYVLSGRINSLKAYVGLCDMAMEWKTVTRRQRKGLKLMYRHGCPCQIKKCPSGRCYRTADTCIWSSKCQTKEGICLPHANKSCRWMSTRALANCTKEVGFFTRGFL